MFNVFKTYVENHINLVLIISVVLALLVPGLDLIPKYFAIIFSASVIFFSCPNVVLEDLKHINIKHALAFYVLRFLFVPVVFYGVLMLFLPDYALAGLLVSLMPVGVAASAISSVTGANVGFALSLTVITTMLAPFLIPAVIFILVGTEMVIDVQSLFVALALSVFLPVMFYFLIVRKIEPIKTKVKENAKFITVLLLGGMLVSVIAPQKEYLIEHFYEVPIVFLLMPFLYFLYYILAWLLAYRMPERDRKTYTIASGVNNLALGAGLAALYFAPLTAISVVMGEIGWILGASVFIKLAGNKKIK